MYGNAQRKRKHTPAEHIARKKYGGMTRRDFNVSQQRPKARTGSYTVRGLWANNPNPQTENFPNEAAALARFHRISSNPALLSVSVLLERTNANGYKRQEAIYSYTKAEQVFASGDKAWWEQRDRRERKA